MIILKMYLSNISGEKTVKPRENSTAWGEKRGNSATVRIRILMYLSLEALVN